MKKADLILCSDFHLRETVPQCRTDDFWETQWEKVVFIRTLQQEHNCPVLMAGDLFHHWKPSPNLLSYAYDILPRDFHCVYGQHDLPQHNWQNREKSGMHNLATVGAVTLLDGAHWGDDPELLTYPSFEIEDRKILVWHRMIWQGKRLWPGQTDPSSVAVLKKYPEYDLVLTGDNHKAFTEEYKGRLLVNPGSLTRQTAGQIDFKPRVYLYSADDNTARPVYLPIPNDAITRVHIDRSDERDGRIQAFVDKLSGEYEVTMSFEANLEQFFKTNNTLASVKNIVYHAIDTI